MKCKRRPTKSAKQNTQSMNYLIVADFFSIKIRMHICLFDNAKIRSNTKLLVLFSAQFCNIKAIMHVYVFNKHFLYYHMRNSYQRYNNIIIRKNRKLTSLPVNCYFGVSNYYMYIDSLQMVVMRFSNCKKERLSLLTFVMKEKDQ